MEERMAHLLTYHLFCALSEADDWPRKGPFFMDQATMIRLDLEFKGRVAREVFGENLVCDCAYCHDLSSDRVITPVGKNCTDYCYGSGLWGKRNSLAHWPCIDNAKSPFGRMLRAVEPRARKKYAAEIAAWALKKATALEKGKEDAEA